MGTSRNAQRCQTHYVTTLDSSIFRGKWSPEEDASLKAAMEVVGRETSDWKSVAKYVRGRTPIQCRERWKGRLSVLSEKGGGKVPKRVWTEEVSHKRDRKKRLKDYDVRFDRLTAL